MAQRNEKLLGVQVLMSAVVVTVSVDAAYALGTSPPSVGANNARDAVPAASAALKRPETDTLRVDMKTSLLDWGSVPAGSASWVGTPVVEGWIASSSSRGASNAAGSATQDSLFQAPVRRRGRGVFQHENVLQCRRSVEPES